MILKPYKSIYKESTKYEIYHRDYTSAIQEVVDYCERNGYEVTDEDLFRVVGSGSRKPSVGKTNSLELPLYKNGKPSNKKIIFQVYNMGSSGSKPYELNMYFGKASMDDFI